MRQRGECQLFSIRRFCRILNQPDLHGTFFDLLREVQLRSDFLRDLSRERNQAVVTRRDVQPVNFSLGGIEDLFSSGHEGVPGPEVTREPRFLVVALDRVLQPAVLAALQIADAQAGFRFIARGVDKRLAVGRNHGTKCAAELAHQDVFVAGSPVAPRDAPQGKHRVVLKSSEAPRVIEIPSVRGHADTQSIVTLIARRRWRRLGFGDLYARPALDVVHPQFVRCQAGRLGDDDVLPIRRPGRRNEFGGLLLAELFGLTVTVRFHDPDVFRAVAVGDEGNPLSVRRVARLAVEGHALGERLGLTALDRKRIEVTEQFEDDGLSVGRNVQREPCAFVGREFDFAVGLERQPFLFVLFLFFFLVLIVLPNGVFIARLSQRGCRPKFPHNRQPANRRQPDAQYAPFRSHGPSLPPSN